MLGDVIGDFLPAALAVALSPIPIIGVVLILGSSHARTAGPAFAAGWIAGLGVVGMLVVLLFPDSSGSGDEGVAWLKLALGLLFFVLAAKQWQKRPKEGEEAEMPAWLEQIGEIAAPRAAALGVALSAVNPKNLALTLATAATIADAGLDAGDEALAIAVFVAIGSVTVAGAVLAYLLLGERVAAALASVRQFMARNNTAIMIVILLLLGVKLVGDAIGGF